MNNGGLPMPRRLLLFGACLCLGGEFVSADVMVNYTSAGDLDPSTPEIELSPNSATTVDISLSNTTTHIIVVDGIDFCFSEPEGMTLSDFHWLGSLADPNQWFAPAELPCPSAVTFAGGVLVPPVPGSIALATINAAVADLPPGTDLSVDTGPPHFYWFGGPVQATPASGYIRFVVVPEPSTALWLLLGVAAGCRRIARRASLIRGASSSGPKGRSHHR